ncbi:MAG: transposase, partial [Candidatus Methylomirabilales bacterium]
SRMGLRTHGASTVAEAKAMLAEHEFDLCFTDMRLPDGDGIAILQHIQRDKPGLPVAVITAYGNAQAAVDGTAQVIVAADVTQAANDKQQLVPMLTQVGANCGARPPAASGDAGYFSEAAVTDAALDGIALYVPPDRQKHGEAPAPPADDGTVIGAMRAKLQTAAGHAVYALRKAIVEPVFGQIKGPRGFRRFAFRGLAKVQAEWQLICLTHNLLKLFRAGWRPQVA